VESLALKVCWGADDGNVAGAARFWANVSVIRLVHLAFATLLARAPRRDGDLGQTETRPGPTGVSQIHRRGLVPSREAWFGWVVPEACSARAPRLPFASSRLLRSLYSATGSFFFQPVRILSYTHDSAVFQFNIELDASIRYCPRDTFCAILFRSFNGRPPIATEALA